MAMSPFEAIQVAAVATVASVPGIAEVTVIPAHEAFKTAERGGEIVLQPSLPKAYPGSVVSLAEEEIKLLDYGNNAGQGWRKYRVPVWISTYAKSPSGGVSSEDAKLKAWEIAYGIQLAMIFCVPDCASLGVTTWPATEESTSTIPTDPMIYGVMQVFNFDYQITAVA